MRTGTTSLGKNTSDYPECDENKVAVGSSQKPSETSHTAQAKFEGFRVLSNSQFGARSGVSAVPERTE